jgi:hypothetical protein
MNLLVKSRVKQIIWNDGIIHSGNGWVDIPEKHCHSQNLNNFMNWLQDFLL